MWGYCLVTCTLCPFTKVKELLSVLSQPLRWQPPPPPTLAGTLDDLEKQLGVEPMRLQVVNIMQYSAKAFIIHLANANQVKTFMAQGITFRGHLLEMSKAKNTTTVILDRVPYGLPEASIKLSLARYGEVKSLCPVTHKGYGLSKFKVEMVLNQDIPSRIAVQGNHLNVFYKRATRRKIAPRKQLIKDLLPRTTPTTRVLALRRSQPLPTSLIVHRLGIRLQLQPVQPPPTVSLHQSPRCIPLLPAWPSRHKTNLPGTPPIVRARCLSTVLNIPTTRPPLWFWMQLHKKWKSRSSARALTLPPPNPPLPPIHQRRRCRSHLVELIVQKTSLRPQRHITCQYSPLQTPPRKSSIRSPTWTDFLRTPPYPSSSSTRSPRLQYRIWLVLAPSF